MVSSYQFGIDDGKVTARNASGVLEATGVDILAIKGFSVSTESDTVQQTGDNEVKRIRKTGKRVTGSATQGATDLATAAIVGDGVTVTDGDSPNLITTYTEPTSSPGKIYQIAVQAADIDGSTRITVPSATTSSGPSFEWAEGAFSDPTFDYEGTGHEGVLFEIAQYETEVPLA